MNFRVRYTDTAKQDLREIAIYIAEQSKEKETAKRFVSRKRSCSERQSFENPGLPLSCSQRLPDFLSLQQTGKNVIYSVGLSCQTGLCEGYEKIYLTGIHTVQKYVKGEPFKRFAFYFLTKECDS